MSVKIIVDSTVDLSPEMKQKVSAVVPMSVLFGETVYQDGVTITAAEFYEKLEGADPLPTTSQPTPAVFEDIYREVTADGSQAVVITLSSRLSGTYQSATIAAEEFPGQVFVVDSRNATLGSGVLAAYAVELAEAGKTGEEILEILMEARKRVRLYAIVDTLEYLKKGGRLSATVAFVGGMLNLKPLISVEEGEIKSLGTARGMKKAFSQLSELSANVDPAMPMLLGYTGAEDTQLRSYANSSELWGENVPVTVVGPTIGVHAGPGAVAVGFFSKE